MQCTGSRGAVFYPGPGNVGGNNTLPFVGTSVSIPFSLDIISASGTCSTIGFVPATWDAFDPCTCFFLNGCGINIYLALVTSPVLSLFDAFLLSYNCR
ncbi:hypothetical protein BDV27DRAFT_136835 [Aspergillus caelatus]|uniref:Uncharacterized protein n=1 Tax=Aspergillus caelatus TaxID=61420 RepID=A0A5N6ZMZ2_9EURO|nr:uncharacterized protein BDV27DRAFT_136835 [Aspergillus caelatus]KAE8358994.1 hypothetical protein BDV27DRAFT_136835 [Aspergillus caelatus]